MCQANLSKKVVPRQIGEKQVIYKGILGNPWGIFGAVAEEFQNLVVRALSKSLVPLAQETKKYATRPTKQPTDKSDKTHSNYTVSNALCLLRRHNKSLQQLIPLWEMPKILTFTHTVKTWASWGDEGGGRVPPVLEWGGRISNYPPTF